MEAAYSTISVCEDIGCESNLLCLDCNVSNTEDQQYGCSNMKDIVEKEIQDDCSHRSEGKKESFIDEVIGVPADGVLLQDSHAQFSENDAISDEDYATDSMMISTYMESGSSVSFDVNVLKCLSKSATFPSSELEFPHSSCVEEMAASQTYKRSVSLPAPSNLVSAMKGGRAQNGMALRLGLRVKWAPDVYDPPESSMLQMVQSNTRQRLKSKKKDKHRHKHAKGKSGGEKKHARGRI